MLSPEDQDFVSSEMKVSIESIDSKLSEGFLSSYRHKFEAAISFFVSCIREQEEVGYRTDHASFENSPAENAINQHYLCLSETIDSVEANAILDSIRHAFCSYAYNGLHQLFTRQENEVWYPKIILDCELKPNDIELLPEIVVLYRGADLAELKLLNFGQSWTTKVEVAREFAYKHYEGQDWFRKESRIILKTEYPKRFVYYASQAPEYEVAIDTSKIGKVERVT
nr:hypothetical protein [uncultured Pseudomonas sp.]